MPALYLDTALKGTCFTSYKPMDILITNGLVKKIRAMRAIVNSNRLVLWFLVAIPTIKTIRVQISGRKRYRSIFSRTNIMVDKGV